MKLDDNTQHLKMLLDGLNDHFGTLDNFIAALGAAKVDSLYNLVVKTQHRTAMPKLLFTLLCNEFKPSSKSKSKQSSKTVSSTTATTAAPTAKAAVTKKRPAKTASPSDTENDAAELSADNDDDDVSDDDDDDDKHQQKKQKISTSSTKETLTTSTTSTTSECVKCNKTIPINDKSIKCIDCEKLTHIHGRCGATSKSNESTFRCYVCCRNDATKESNDYRRDNADGQAVQYFNSISKSKSTDVFRSQGAFIQFRTDNTYFNQK